MHHISHHPRLRTCSTDTILRAIHELATVLSDLENLQKEKEKSAKRIAYLKSKLESKTEE